MLSERPTRLVTEPPVLRAATYRAILRRGCCCGQHAPDGGCAECRKKRQSLQRQATNEAQPWVAPPLVQDVLRSEGRPLEPATRCFMESGFGHDFSVVRVHTDAKAAESAYAINSLAYTIGRDIIFGKGHYQPGTTEGRRLLAHELAHVVQQEGQPSPADGQLRISEPGEALEREADLIASAVTQDREIPRDASQKSDVRVERQLSVERSNGGNATASLPIPLRIPRTVKTWINTFIPHRQISGPPGSDCFAGDNRGFSNFIHASSRTHQETEVEVGSLKRTIDWKHVGATHEINCSTGGLIDAATAPTSQLRNGPVVSRTSADINIFFSAAAKNPLVTLAPAIDLEAVFRVNPMTRRCTFEIEHDGFPAYEAYVTTDGGAGIPVYTYDPTTAGKGISALFPPMDVSATVTGASF